MDCEDTFRDLWEQKAIPTRMCNDVIRFCRKMDRSIERWAAQKEKP
jgi:hypothetical protein